MRRVVILLGIGLIFGGCSKLSDDRNLVRQDLKVTKAQQEYVDQGNDLGFSVLGKMDNLEKEEYLFSPLSMQISLGMIVAGAKGNTAKEIVSALGYGEDTRATVEYLSSLSSQLKRMDRATDISIANAFVYNTSSGKTVLPSFKETLSKYNDSRFFECDFNDKESSAKLINDWVDTNTDGKINALIDENNPLSGTATAVLLNALSFKSLWSVPFDKKKTRDDKFYQADDRFVTLPFMHLTGSFNYCEDAMAQLLTMDYGNGAYRFTVVLPQANVVLNDVVNRLKGRSVIELLSNTSSQKVIVSIPTFTRRSHVDMVEMLNKCGINDAFSETEADFGNMIDSGKGAVCVSQMVQRAIFQLDESGTEAAVVTGTVFDAPTAAPPDEDVSVIFTANHPFLYMITERSSGAILFLGTFTGNDGQ